ncbi:Glycerol kinase [hydrothermal vent metagenome]|uniref:glycerol kinase n=1 Tax=hydrothermal vent metagenome TaxID=652676 RepID=A0A3B0UDN8_9ZZZZ
MEKKYILALDQGTTSSRAIIYDHAGKIISMAQKEFRQIFPEPGFVEHDPMEIYSSQISVAAEAMAQMEIHDNVIAAIGITNQRETTIVWNRKTGKPVYNAIVWQDRRTSAYCDRLKKRGLHDWIAKKTGLEIDAYFSATKIKWILDNVTGARKAAENGELAFGTVDSWLMWNLSNGKAHLTDTSNASRTMLFNIHTLQWDEDLLKLFDIPASMLPEVKSNSTHFTDTSGLIFSSKIPISGVAGDQQAALFGQMCVHQGMVKNTYGTGCFIMLNTGDKAVRSKNRMLTTVAWQLNNKTTYALEGSVFVGGAVIQWLRDGIKLIKSSSYSEKLALSVEDTDGVIFVPAFTGLGAPHWDQDARGMIYGITRGTTRAHIIRAALEAIAYQSYDVMKAMQQDAGFAIENLRVDGGAAANNLLMQMQADMLQTNVQRPVVLESTSLGVAYFAGLAVGFWKDVAEIESQWQVEKTFTPAKNAGDVKKEIAVWHDAVARVLQKY